MAILELIHATNPGCLRDVWVLLLDQDQNRFRPVDLVVTLDNFADRTPSGGDASFKCLPYQLSMVGYAPTMVVTGNGESGFDSGEGA